MFRIIGWTLEVEGHNRDEASMADKSPGFPGWIPPENKSRQQSACQNKSAGIFIHLRFTKPRTIGKKFLLEPPSLLCLLKLTTGTKTASLPLGNSAEAGE